MNSMGSDRFRKAIGKVKDHTRISLARVSSSTDLPELEVAIVKATRHAEYPAEDRHIREIITLTNDSQIHVASCVSLISGRLDKTRNWIVALKVLILIQRLLQDGDRAYEREIFYATRRGTRLLNMSDFRDMSRTNSWDFSAFIRTYSLYLDEYLEYRMQGGREKHDDEPEPEPEPVTLKSPVDGKTKDNLFSRLQHLMQLLERFLACRPTGCGIINIISSPPPPYESPFTMTENFESFRSGEESQDCDGGIVPDCETEHLYVLRHDRCPEYFDRPV